MRRELLDGLSPAQRTALEEFHNGHMSAGELCRRLGDGTGPNLIPDGTGPNLIADGTGPNLGDTQAMPVAGEELSHGVPRIAVARGRHLFALLVLAILLGATGATVGATGLSAGIYRGSAHRLGVASRSHRHAAVSHATKRAVHSAATAGPAVVSRHRKHKTAANVTHKSAVKHRASSPAIAPVTSTAQQAPPTTTTSTSTSSTTTSTGTTTTGTSSSASPTPTTASQAGTTASTATTSS
jgi:hypothetical protein